MPRRKIGRYFAAFRWHDHDEPQINSSQIRVGGTGTIALAGNYSTSAGNATCRDVQANGRYPHAESQPSARTQGSNFISHFRQPGYLAGMQAWDRRRSDFRCACIALWCPKTTTQQVWRALFFRSRPFRRLNYRQFTSDTVDQPGAPRATLFSPFPKPIHRR